MDGCGYRAVLLGKIGTLRNRGVNPVGVCVGILGTCMGWDPVIYELGFRKNEG